MTRPKRKDDIDYQILRTIKRINCLLELNIFLARLRLAGINLDINKYMKIYNGNKKNLKICYQNIPGTISNFNLIATIQSFLDRIDPDVLAIAEPCTEDLNVDWHPYVLLPGHIEKGKKTRLNLLVKSNLKFNQKYWKVELPHKVLEIGDWRFVFVYREWAKCGDQATKDIKQQETRWRGFVDRWMKERGKRTAVIGDMNFDYMDGGGSQRQLKNIRSMVMDDVISDGWYQLVRENTRYQNQQKPSCLDHIYTRSVADIKTVLNSNQTGYDHNFVGLDINLSKRILHPQVYYTRDIEGIAINDFTNCFLTLDLAGIMEAQHVDDAVELLTHNINVTLNHLAPLKKRFSRMKTSADWLTPQLRERIVERNELRKKAVKTGSKHHWMEFKRCRNRLKSDLLFQKKHWTQAQLTRANGDSRSRWRAIKTATEGKRLTNDINLNINGTLLVDPEAVANHLNRYYVKKVQDIIDVAPPDPTTALEYTREYLDLRAKPPPEFEFQCVDQYQVLEIIKSLKSTGAVGHDGISTKVIKKFHQVLLPFITKIINLSVMTSMYPQTWKYGIISPVPKPGDLTIDKNWRPVTLLPIMSKIHETVLNKQLKTFLESNRILSQNQHAYRASRSTHTAWADLDSKIQKATDAGKYVGLLLVDMSAAFNLVSKEVVIPKLKMMGVGEYATKLLFSYLTSRQSRVKVKGVYSAWVKVKTGIGEGSVLGPLVFILTIFCCIIVLHRVIKRLGQQSITAKIDDGKYDTEVSLSSTEFADDVTGLAVTDTEQQLQHVLQVMAEEYQKYFSSHGLKINVTKSEHLVIGSPRRMTIMIDGRKEADSVKLLGLTVDKHYKFDKHVDIITEKMSRRNGQLSKLAGQADEQTMQMLATSTIQSIATYGAHVYAADQKNVNRVQVKLNKTMRLVTKSKLIVSIADLLVKMKWLKMQEQVDLCKLNVLYNIVTTSSAPFCATLIADARHQTRYVVRERELKIAWRARLARRGQKSFLVTAVKLFNQTKIAGKVIPQKKVGQYFKQTLLSWRN